MLFSRIIEFWAELEICKRMFTPFLIMAILLCSA